MPNFRLSGLALAGALLAWAGPAPAEEPLVLWSLPAAASHRPQTDAEEEAGREHGRAVPAPELLQPTLDPALRPYQPRPAASLSGHFRAAASDVLPGLASAWIGAFERLYPDVHIDLGPPYAGSLGAKELIADRLDMVFVSRELKPDDISGFRARFGYPPLSVPISGGSYRQYGFLDSIAFFVNPRNPLTQLTFRQLDAVLSSTRARGGEPIRTWGQLGLTGDWADKPIHVYAIKPWNGFEEFVRQRVLSIPGKRGEWRDDLHFDKVVFPVASEVAQDPYGLGYSGVAYIDAAVKTLSLSAQDVSGGTATAQPAQFVAPTYEAVAAATYPLSRLIYLNTNRRPGTRLPPALEEFLRFILSRDGQQIVLNQAIYLPLRASQVQQSTATLEP